MESMPTQPTAENSAEGSVEIYTEFNERLRDLDGFSHLILLYHLHGIDTAKLLVTPFLDSVPRGVFSTRAPVRPNPIGLSVVRLVGIADNILQIADLDVLDGTPLLDIKPYIPDFDRPSDVRIGWLEHVDRDVKSMKSDDRFSQE
jgi:tRNA-Thr(GGU) m(6)t(6)A37 methyltransferase TsaA